MDPARSFFCHIERKSTGITADACKQNIWLTGIELSSSSLGKEKNPNDAADRTVPEDIFPSLIAPFRFPCLKCCQAADSSEMRNRQITCNAQRTKKIRGLVSDASV